MIDSGIIREHGTRRGRGGRPGCVYIYISLPPYKNYKRGLLCVSALIAGLVVRNIGVLHGMRYLSLVVASGMRCGVEHKFAGGSYEED